MAEDELTFTKNILLLFHLYCVFHQYQIDYEACRRSQISSISAKNRQQQKGLIGLQLIKESVTDNSDLCSG